MNGREFEVRRQTRRPPSLGAVAGALTIFWLIVGACGQPAARPEAVDMNHYAKSTHSHCYEEPTPQVEYVGLPGVQNQSYYAYDHAGGTPTATRRRGAAQRCVPDFINAAYLMPVEATNVCGLIKQRPTRYCVHSSHQKLSPSQQFCGLCSNFIPGYEHHAGFLTDFNNASETWWQSETMAEGIDWPRSVNLTLDLGKAYDITYVRLKFISPRPESFAIYKKTHADSPWTPWQYYSASCRSTYKLPEKAPILPSNEAMAQCTREFSDISPLTEGNIAFSTLEGRPSEVNFEESEVLQEWVTATAIRISLDRLNTFGDEIYKGGRCKCNGHAGRCVASTGPVLDGIQSHRLVCDCQHNTAGVDCERCASFYMDRPWRPATSLDANECLPCNCNGLSNRCYFDAQLFEATGHGGHCVDCAGNTTGPHCEYCAPNHWRLASEHHCRPCECNAVGAVSRQCDTASGACVCKPGVIGQRCDSCADGFHSLGPNGCQDCGCSPVGTVPAVTLSDDKNKPTCSADGACFCKPNVEGQRCDRCRPGHFALSEVNELGCTPCFCYGHSATCEPAEGYISKNISSDFMENAESWTARSDVRQEPVQWAVSEKAVAIAQFGDRSVYFEAPSRFLGDQRLAYDQVIELELRIRRKTTEAVRAAGNMGNSRDLIIIGEPSPGQRVELTLSLNAQSSAQPLVGQSRKYTFRLNADPRFGWQPRLRPVDFIAILANVTAIRVRGTFSRGEVGFLSRFSVGSAMRADLSVEPSPPAAPAVWVESCTCPTGHEGRFCERCAPGYRRVRPFGGPTAKCVLCVCNGHADNDTACDPESGVCQCAHNTAGDNCERCARGFWGDALRGEVDACRACDCPNGGSCALLDGTIAPERATITDTVCTDCPEGHGGQRCEYCLDGYYGNPLDSVPCQRCDCHGNVDANAIGICDAATGDCIRCVYNTTGTHCERCAPGHWGDALTAAAAEAGGIDLGCPACDCYVPGSVPTLLIIDTNAPRNGTLVTSFDRSPSLDCRASDGQCTCRANVVGRRCDKCAPGYFNITSSAGCLPCGCDPLGSLDGQCDELTGRCVCRLGVTGEKCDACARRHYGFGSENGCAACDCDEFGAEDGECDPRNGQCLCLENVEGRRCDRCTENHFDLAGGCPPCDDCYALIQRRRDELLVDVSALRVALEELTATPVQINDEVFNELIDETRRHLSELAQRVDAKFGVGDVVTSMHDFVALRDALEMAGASARNATRRLGDFDLASDTLESRLIEWTARKDELRQEVDVAIDELKTRAASAAAAAEAAATRDANSKLTYWAEEAVALSERQSERVHEARRLSAEVLRLSSEALHEAYESLNGGFPRKLSELETCVTEAERALAAVRRQAADAEVNAEHVHDEAARQLGSISDIDVSMRAAEVNALLDRNAKLVAEWHAGAALAAERTNASTSIFAAASEALDVSKKQLDSVREQYEESEKIAARLGDASSRAQAAVDAAVDVFEQMQTAVRLLDELTDEEEMERQRAVAAAAMGSASHIDATIGKVDAWLQRVANALATASDNAQYAREIAERTRDDARAFAEPLKRLLVDSGQLRATVDDALVRLRDLERAVEAAESTSHARLEALSRDRERVGEAARHAGSAENLARAANESAIASEALVWLVLQRLDSSDKPADDAELTALEKLVDDLEDRVASAELDDQLKVAHERYETLQAARRRLSGDLAEARTELAALETIRNRLPTRCFNRVGIEQDGA